MLLFYKLYGSRAFDYFSIMHDKRDVMVNELRMIKQSCWDVFDSFPPGSADYFAFDDKLGRAFICADSSIHSIAFPFHLEICQDVSMVTVRWGDLTVDTAAASLAISALMDNPEPFIDLEEAVLVASEESFTDTSIDCDEIVRMLSYLANTDDGYFRHDHDVEYKQKLRGRIENRRDDGLLNGQEFDLAVERRHPVNHIDMFYSDRVSVKLGLSARFSLEDLRKMISKESDAFQLKLPGESE